jgi:hypothetical protein
MPCIAKTKEPVMLAIVIPAAFLAFTVSYVMWEATWASR